MAGLEKHSGQTEGPRQQVATVLNALKRTTSLQLITPQYLPQEVEEGAQWYLAIGLRDGHRDFTVPQVLIRATEETLLIGLAQQDNSGTLSFSPEDQIDVRNGRATVLVKSVEDAALAHYPDDVAQRVKYAADLRRRIKRVNFDPTLTGEEKFTLGIELGRLSATVSEHTHVRAVAQQLIAH